MKKAIKNKVTFKMQAIKEFDSVNITIFPNKAIEIEFRYFVGEKLRLTPSLASIFSKGLAGEPESIAFDSD